MAPDDHDHDPTTERYLAINWAAHRRAMLLAALASLSALLLVYSLHPGPVRETTVQAVRVQLVLMSLAIPAAAVGGRTRLDVLCRGGTVNDAFGVGLLIVMFSTSGLSVVEALQLYLLVSAVGLLCLGVFWWIREATARPWAGAVGAVTLGLAVWAGAFEGTAGRTAVEAPASAGQWMLANADLHGAVRSCLGLAETPSPWYGVLLVYAAAAGLAWSGPLLAADDSDAQSERAPRADGRDEEE